MTNVVVARTWEDLDRLLPKTKDSLSKRLTSLFTFSVIVRGENEWGKWTALMTLPQVVKGVLSNWRDQEEESRAFNEEADWHYAHSCPICNGGGHDSGPLCPEHQTFLDSLGGERTCCINSAKCVKTWQECNVCTQVDSNYVW